MGKSKAEEMDFWTGEEFRKFIDSVMNKRLSYMDYVDLALDFKLKKLADFIDVINENSKIARKFKPILTEYCTRVFDKYPDIELRPFYRNLKDLEVIECTDQELLKVTWDTNSCGCYVRDEDKIYVLKDKEYEEGTRDYHDDSRENPQSVYYPIYDYISKMYLDEYVTADMSYDEAKEVMDQMLDRLLFDVPEEYHIDRDHFYTYLDDYYENNI